MIWARRILIISLTLLSHSEAYDKKSIALKPLNFFNPTFKSLKNVDGESKPLRFPLYKNSSFSSFVIDMSAEEIEEIKEYLRNLTEMCLKVLEAMMRGLKQNSFKSPPRRPRIGVVPWGSSI